MSALVLRTRKLRNQRGMTLVEMLIGLTIMGIIMTALFNASLFFIQHATDADARFADDTTAQLADTLFTADAQSAQSVTLNDSSTSACKGIDIGDPGNALISFSWDDFGRADVASWYVTTTFGQRPVLQRRKCVDGTLTNSTDMDGVQAGTVVTSCAPDCTAPTTVTLKGTATNGSAFAVTGSLRTGGV